MNWDSVRKEWETSKITLKDLAEKHDIKLGTLKSRKSREGWSRGSPKKDATRRQKVATLPKKDATPKKNKEIEKEPVIESDDLTDKQRLFCLYYTKYWNATKAYQKAYECTYLTARVEGSRNLTKPNIKDEINRIKEEQSRGILLDGRTVLQKYIDIAFADITDFVEFGQKEITVLNELTGEEENVEINYVDFKNHKEVDGTIITEVKKGKDGISVKLADKMKALEFLAKYTDLLSDFDRKRLQDEKLKAETQLTKERTKLLQGEKKDTSLLETLIETVTSDD